MPDDRERLQIDGRNFSHGRQSDFFSLYTKCKLDVSKTVFWKTPVKWLWLSLWKRQLNGSDCHCENRCFEKDNVSGTLSSSTFSTQPVCKMLQESSIAACQLFRTLSVHWGKVAVEYYWGESLAEENCMPFKNMNMVHIWCWIEGKSSIN